MVEQIVTAGADIFVNLSQRQFVIRLRRSQKAPLMPEYFVYLVEYRVSKINASQEREGN